jgi:hypothetical protein
VPDKKPEIEELVEETLLEFAEKLYNEEFVGKFSCSPEN